RSAPRPYTTLFRSDEPLAAKARAEAVAEARARAEELAKLAGVRLGRALEQLQRRSNPEAQATQRSTPGFRFPRPDSGRSRVARDGDRRTAHRIGLVDEERVVVFLFVVPGGDPANQHHIAGAKQLQMPRQVGEEHRLVTLRNPLPKGNLHDVEQLRVLARELD